MDDIAIKVEHVNKTFKLPHEKSGSVKNALINITRHKKGYETQHVLKDVSFEIRRGDFFGIVGRNGSGKSTLLKLLAGIYTPTSGTVHVNGKLTPFIELGVGFNPELTGRENVFLNGALLGFNRKEMNLMYQDIVEFAELERFMDQKLKNYSSGMQVRLAFSIAIRAESDILVLDEVLAVGDLDFQRKCYDYFINLKREAKTVILVTHDMSAVRRFCTNSMLIQDGALIFQGAPNEAAEKYETLNLRAAEKRVEEENKTPTKRSKREGTRQATIKKVETFNTETGKSQNTFNAQEKIGVRITFTSHTKLESPTVGFIFQDENDITVFATTNKIKKYATKDVKDGDMLILETVVDNVFTNNAYTITCAIESKDLSVIYDRITYIHSFIIGGHLLAHATTHASHDMKVYYE